MKAYWTRTVAPVLPVVSLSEAKRHAWITDDTLNGAVQSAIVVATEDAEDYLGYGLLTQTWRYDLSEWAEVIPLPMAKVLQSITSVKYYDADGVLQTLSSTYYTTDTTRLPACLVRAADMTWPELESDRQTGRIQITYVVGWSAAGSVPERIKRGILMRVKALVDDRDGSDPVSQARGWEGCWSDRLYHVDPCVFGD